MKSQYKLKNKIFFQTKKFNNYIFNLKIKKKKKVEFNKKLFL